MAEKKPTGGDTVRVHLILDADEVQAIDDFSFEHRIRTRSEAMRVLIRRGLGEEGKDGHVGNGTAKT